MMSHNPDPNPRTPEAWQNGIKVRYASYEYSCCSFGMLESRKFKTQRGNGIHLLGESQETWLQNWRNTQSDKIRIVLTQTIFDSIPTVISKLAAHGMIPVDLEQLQNSNGWPTPGRNGALRILQGCSPLPLSGDQNIGVALSYDNFGITECSAPAAVNTQRWQINNNTTLEQATTDELGNRYTLHCVWNVDPSVISTFSLPINSQGVSNNMVKHNCGDSFRVVRVTDLQATREARGYQIATGNPEWEYTFSVSDTTTVPIYVPSHFSSNPRDVPIDTSTEKPTQVPALILTDVPSFLPLHTPIATSPSVPSNLPTYAPTDVHSNQPSVVQTEVPTQTPDDASTQAPTLPNTSICYQDPKLNKKEMWTSLNWPNAQRPRFVDALVDFFSFDSMPGQSTLIAGILFSFTTSGILKMSVLFPPLHFEEDNLVKIIVT